jgi:hypothetical protein
MSLGSFLKMSHLKNLCDASVRWRRVDDYKYEIRGYEGPVG